MPDRRAARQLAHDAVSAGEPLRWFEQLYAAADADGLTVPWADLVVNPQLETWAMLEPETMRRVLVVGCGYGDDAEWLAARGCEVTAFDVSESAIRACRARFPASAVSYEVADLLAPPPAWLDQPFDLVAEIYTVQVFAPGSDERAAVIRALVPLTAGTLLVIARGRGASDDGGSMPWPLFADELRPLETLGLVRIAFDDYLDDEDPPVRRLRATYARRAPV
jgi:SAM-dependent methyltransferase